MIAVFVPYGYASGTMSFIVKHLYLHVPFCRGKCQYCAFYKEPPTPATLQGWLAAVAQEIRQATNSYDIATETIYMGGGTPSLLDVAEFEELQACLHHHLNLTSLREWTIECNPESISPEKYAHWRKAGVNRISVGIQSLDQATLRKMGREHDASTIHDALAILRQHPECNWGLDLIAGYPGTTEHTWRTTIRQALALAPDHLSVYECSLHPGTPLDQAISDGRLQPPSAAACTRALRLVERYCQAAGYEHYETSNYCKPGKRCRHNLAVWQGQDYLGIGPAASSRVGLQRWTNHPDLAAYLHNAGNGAIPRDTEPYTPIQDATERIMFAFRLRDPIRLKSYLPRDPEPALQLQAHWTAQLQKLRAQGLVSYRHDLWRTTPKGRRWVDHIAACLLP